MSGPRIVVEAVVIGGVLNRVTDPTAQMLALRDDDNAWKVASFHLTPAEARQWIEVLREYADDLEHAAASEATS